MAIALGGSTTGQNSALDTTVSSAAGNVPSGSLIVVAVVGQEAGNASVSVSDTAGNTYTQTTLADNGASCSFFYAENCTGNASNVVTATYGVNTRYKHIVQSWWTSAATSSSLHAQNGATGGATVTSGTLTSVPSGALIMSVATSTNDRTWSPDSTFTELADFGTSCGVQYEIGGATGNRTTTMTPSASSNCAMATAVFKEGAATPPPTGRGLMLGVG